MAFDEGIRIFLNRKEEKDAVLIGSTSEQKYIILMNDTLQLENRNFRIQISDMETKINNYEEENDRYDTSNRYTKGLLKNYVEIEKFNKELVVIYNKMYSHLKDRFVISKNELTYSINIVEICILLCLILLLNFNFITFSILLENFHSVIVIVVTLLLCHVNIKKYYTPQDFISEIERIKIITTELKKITDSQDFISDHIDSL